jgi:Mycothiol maleylpyruvate isomerase N-terminal domain
MDGTGRTRILDRMRTTKGDMGTAEDTAWTEFLALLESLPQEQIERPGYYPEGWSAKDLMAHVAAWQAEAVQVLEQIRNGTYRAEESTPTDEMNQRFFEANKDLPPSVVWAELFGSRNRMLLAFRDLGEVTPEAEEWFVESGVEHYQEHVGRLREWAEELRAGA